MSSPSTHRHLQRPRQSRTPRLSPAFRAAQRYAKTIPQKPDKRRAIRHLCKKLLAAIVQGRYHDAARRAGV